MLLPAKVDLIPKEQKCKKDTLIAYRSGHIKIILTFAIKIIAFYIQTSII